MRFNHPSQRVEQIPNQFQICPGYLVINMAQNKLKNLTQGRDQHQDFHQRTNDRFGFDFRAYSVMLTQILLASASFVCSGSNPVRQD